MNPKSIFRNPMGKRYLQGLFYEETLADKSSVVYTLKREDHLGYPSLYRLYMDEGDITEYRFALKYLDGWSHWQELLACSWFKSYIEAWRDELTARIRSTALAGIVAVSLDEANPASYHANKYLLEAVGKPAGALKRGRPTKDEVQQELKRQAASKAQIDDDSKRIGLN